MATMGAPPSLQAQRFKNVKMGPRKIGPAAGPKEPTKAEKEKLLNKLTGHKPKSIYKEGKHNEIGKDQFLQLLTHQLQNQDPMNPMEQNKFAAELAQFSQLEQLSSLNTKFDGLTKNQKMEDKFYGASFLGKEIVTNGNSINYKGEGTDADIMFNLPEPASKVAIRILDKKNNIVGEIWKEGVGRGHQQVAWDGERLDGQYAGKGEFSIKVMAWDGDANPINVSSKTTGKVESVFFENGETVFLVNGRKLYMRDVDSFHVPGGVEKNHKQIQADASRRQTAVNALGAAIKDQQKLPVASNKTPVVNLENTGTVPNQQQAVNNYKSVQQQKPSTGVYDEPVKGVYDE